MRCRELQTKVSPPGYGISWYGVSYQEQLAGAQGPMLYLVSLLVVFLSLAALYESWSIPFAVMLVVPLGIIGAILAALITQYVPVKTVLSNDVYFQVGLLTTVGLAAKNAILIVEFAKDLYDRGERLTEAVIHAAKIRFRPDFDDLYGLHLRCYPSGIKLRCWSCRSKRNWFLCYRWYVNCYCISNFLCSCILRIGNEILHKVCSS